MSSNKRTRNENPGSSPINSPSQGRNHRRKLRGELDDENDVEEMMTGSPPVPMPVTPNNKKPKTRGTPIAIPGNKRPQTYTSRANK